MSSYLLIYMIVIIVKTYKNGENNRIQNLHLRRNWSHNIMELLFLWIVSLVIMLGGGLFVYESLKDAIKHVKSYRDEKAEKRLLWWYLEWTLLIPILLFGIAGRFNLITALIFFSIGAIPFVITTYKIITLL